MEDAVLRMLMDKYKPLRTGLSKEEGLSNKLAAVKPRDKHTPAADPHHNDDAVPHTPAGQPWNAVYVRPTHMRGDMPKIYRGSIEPPPTPLDRVLHARGLKQAPINPGDSRAKTNLRKALGRAATRDRVEAAVGASLDYASRPENASLKDVENEREQGRPLQVVGARGIAGIAEKRIQEALQSGAFARNSLHGQELPYDNAWFNPHLGPEEFLMNRIVRRQGAAPVWVEHNANVQFETRVLRQAIQHAWICRALLRFDEERRTDLEPVRVTWTSPVPPQEHPTYMYEAESDGANATIEWAASFRDPAWVRRETPYHDEAIRSLNETIRRYNHVSPPTARKMQYTRASFIHGTLQDAVPLIVEGVSARLRGRRIAPPPPPQVREQSWAEWLFT